MRSWISPSILTRNFVLLCLASFLFFSSYHLLSPVIPKYVKMQHLTGMLMGTIISSFMVSSLLMRPWIGKLNDEFNQKLLIALGVIIFASCSLTYAFIHDPTLLIIVRVIHGAGFALFYTSSSVYLTCILPSNNKAEGISYYGNAIKLAMAFSPALGLWMLEHNWYLPAFVLSSCLGLLTFLCVLFIKGTEQPSLYRNKIKGKLVNSKAFFPGLVMGANNLAFGALIPFVPLLVEEKGLEMAGLFYTIFAICLIGSRGVTGKVSDQHGRGWVVVPGMAMVAIAMIIMSWAPSEVYFLVAAGLYGFGTGTVQPSLMAITADRTTPQERGSAMATFTLLNDLGIASGSFLMGSLGEMVGYSRTLIWLSGVVIAGCIYFFLKVKSEEAMQAKVQPEVVEVS